MRRVRLGRCGLRLIGTVLLAAWGLAARAEAPAADAKADEQFRHALSLLLNTRVALHDEAAQEFQAFLAAFPTDARAPLAHFWLGECWVRAERYEDALREHTLVADRHAQCERHAEALFRVGELNHRLGRFEAAVKANERFLQQYGTHDLAKGVRERDALSRVARLQDASTQDEEAALKQALAEAKRDDVVGREALALLNALQFKRGEFAAAATAGEAFLKKFPDAENAEEVRFNTGAAYLRLQDDQRALAHLREVRRHRAGEAAYLRGAILLRLKQEREAQAEFRRVADDFADSPYGSHSLFELGRAGDIKAREALIAKAPGSDLADQTLCLWASELSAAGKHEAALERLAAVKAESPLHAEAQRLRAGCLYQVAAAREKNGEAAAAVKAYEELVRQYPQDRHAPYALLRLGALLLDTDRAAALRLLERIATEHPGFEHAAQADALIAHGRYAEAWALYEGKQFEKAAPLFAALADNAELGADAAYTAALCYRSLNRPAEQEALFQRLRERHPDFKHAAEVRRLLGELLVEQQKWQEAAVFYTDWARDEKEAGPRADAQLKGGLALYQLNQFPRAKELLTEAAEHGEPYVKARATFTLGEMELNRRNYEDAKRLFLKVSVLYEHAELTPAAMVEAAKCMQQLGAADPARKLLQAVAKDYPKSAVAAGAQALLQEKGTPP